MNTWPATLPQPTMSFTNDVETSSIRTKTEFGRYRARSRFMRQMRTMKVTFEMTDDQRTIFADFWKTEINNGADWFNMTLPLTEGLTTQKVRFVASSYAEAHQPILNWKITATLETDTAIIPLTAEEIEALLDAGGIDDIEAAVARLYAVELAAAIIPA